MAAAISLQSLNQQQVASSTFRFLHYVAPLSSVCQLVGPDPKVGRGFVPFFSKKEKDKILNIRLYRKCWTFILQDRIQLKSFTEVMGSCWRIPEEHQNDGPETPRLENRRAVESRPIVAQNCHDASGHISQSQRAETQHENTLQQLATC